MQLTGLHLSVCLDQWFPKWVVRVFKGALWTVDDWRMAKRWGNVVRIWDTWNITSSLVAHCCSLSPMVPKVGRKWATGWHFLNFFVAYSISSVAYYPARVGNVLGSEHIYGGELPLPSPTNSLYLGPGRI